MQPWAKSFYKSQSWKHARDAAWHRDAGLCVDCFKAGRITPAEEVHHITPLTPENIGNPNISLALSNLVSLCRLCHRARHEGEHDAQRKRRYKIDKNGNVTILDTLPLQ